jgi:hypothetical protein
MIGEKMWIFMGIPILFGSGLSVLISYFLFQKKPIYEFKQLESYFRTLILVGGGALITVLLSQILGLLTGFLIFTVLSLVFSTLGGLMIISCLNLLCRSRPTLALSE